MISTVLTAFLLLFALYYVVFFINVQRGLNNLKRKAHWEGSLPSVSVVVAARNEENTIEQCVLEILNQQYPPDLFELIVIDDNSTDRTSTILSTIRSMDARLTVVSVGHDGTGVPGGKPSAIAAGVKTARGEIILTTDADCIVPSTWIRTMIGYLPAGAAFAAGPVRERPTHTMLSHLSQLEFLGVISTSAGLIGNRRPIICNGANLAYRKEAFFAAQGFGNTGNWCDDETLMHRIYSRHLGSVCFAASAEAVVETASADSLSSFWRQRLRWSAKGNHYERVSVLMRVIGLYFFFLFLLAAFIDAIFHQQVILWFSIAFFAKLVVDYSTLSKGAKLFQDHVQFLAFLVAELLQIPYVVLTAALGQFISIDWKGRAISP